MPDADKPEFAKQSFKGFVMRIMMMIDMFKKKSDCCFRSQLLVC